MVVSVRVVVQVGEQGFGAKDALTPGGRSETVKDTACAVPETRVAVMVLVTEAP